MQVKDIVNWARALTEAQRDVERYQEAIDAAERQRAEAIQARNQAEVKYHKAFREVIACVKGDDGK